MPGPAKPYDDPTVFLRDVMNNPEADVKLRIDFARNLLMYSNVLRSKLTKGQTTDEIAKSAATRGKYKPSAPPARVVDIRKGRKP